MTNTTEKDDMDAKENKPSANASSSGQNTEPANTDPASPANDHSGGGEDASGQGQGNEGGAGKKRNVRETGDEERDGDEEAVADGDRETTRPSKKQKIDGGRRRRKGKMRAMRRARRRRRRTTTSTPEDVKELMFKAIRSRFDYTRLMFTCKDLYATGRYVRYSWFPKYCLGRWYENDGETPRDSKSPLHRKSAISSVRVEFSFRTMQLIETLCKFDENLDSVENLNFQEAACQLFEKEFEDFRKLHGVPLSYLQTFARVGGTYVFHKTFFAPLLAPELEMGPYLFNVEVKSAMNLLDAKEKLAIDVKTWDGSKRKFPHLTLSAIDSSGNILSGRVFWRIPLPNGRVVFDDGTFSNLFADFKWRKAAASGPGSKYSYILEQCTPKRDFHLPPAAARSVIPRAQFRLDTRGPRLDLLAGPVIWFTLHTIVWEMELFAK
ncbi:hypothetical protein HK104_005690 [Borealophlyctis nickersoniae]|nr:hypothetical protein HK104_005690 [Borealophlyctis nickersoniae]